MRKIEYHPGFFLLLLFLMSAEEAESLFMFIAAAIIHESGHAVMMVLSGKKIDRLTVLPMGFDIKYSGGEISYFSDILVALGGPASNFISAVFLSKFGSDTGFVFTGANLALCFFNMLPVYPLDGGRIVYLVSEWIWGPYTGGRIFSAVSVLFSILLFLLASAGALRENGAWPALMFTFLLFRQRRIFHCYYRLGKL